jgi:hypothetical protein
MHTTPFGTIVFDREVDGIKTFVNDKGFHVLIEVYPEAEKQFNMIQNGHWGLSWSMAPLGAKTEVRQASDGKLYPHFVKGIICEISVVDSPSHPDCEAYLLQRGIYGSNTPPEPEKRFTMQGFTTYELNADGSLSMIEKTEEAKPTPQPRTFPTRNSEVQANPDRYTRMKNNGKQVGEDGFLRGETE